MKSKVIAILLFFSLSATGQTNWYFSEIENDKCFDFYRVTEPFKSEQENFNILRIVIFDDVLAQQNEIRNWLPIKYGKYAFVNNNLTSECMNSYTEVIIYGPFLSYKEAYKQAQCNISAEFYSSSPLTLKQINSYFINLSKNDRVILLKAGLNK